MPLDSLDYRPADLAPAYVPPTPEVFWNASPAERRLMLAELLEHEDKLPLKWDFEYMLTGCGTAGCAMGSARQQWGEIDRWKTFGDIGATFGLSSDEAFESFARPTGGYGVASFAEVTPAMVAAKLRAYRP